MGVFMFNKMITFIYKKTLELLPALAFIIAVASVNSICFYFSYQPDVPQELLNDKIYTKDNQGK